MLIHSLLALLHTARPAVRPTTAKPFARATPLKPLRHYNSIVAFLLFACPWQGEFSPQFARSLHGVKVRWGGERRARVGLFVFSYFYLHFSLLFFHAFSFVLLCLLLLFQPFAFSTSAHVHTYPALLRYCFIVGVIFISSAQQALVFAFVFSGLYFYSFNFGFYFCLHILFSGAGDMSERASERTS